MEAMVLAETGAPLVPMSLPTPKPRAGQVLIEVAACAVCRTDLHVVDGDLPPLKLPIIPGHEIVGRVAEVGPGVVSIGVGQRVGVPWLGHTCGYCHFCLTDRENLCDQPSFTGYQIDGGFATHTVADAAYCFPIPERYDDIHAAPLLCAGLIGYRSLKMAGEAKRLGIYGFGAAAHIVAQVAAYQGRKLYAFTRPGDRAAQSFAKRLGCVWAGGSDERPPKKLEAAIIFAPAGGLVPVALGHLEKGGVLVLGGIHMSPVPEMSYNLLWGERVVRSVANLTRRDGEEFLVLAAAHPIETTVETFPLSAANEALGRLRNGQLTGAAVLTP